MPVLLESRSGQLRALEDLENQIQDALQLNVDATTRALLRTYDTKLNHLVNDLKNLHDNFFHGGPGNYTEYMRRGVQRRVEDFIKRDIATLDADVNQLLADSLRKQFEDSNYRWTWALDQTTPPNITPQFGMPPEFILRQALAVTWRGNMFSQEIGAINDDAARQIQSSFNSAMINGDSAWDLGRRIRGQVGIDEYERLVTRPLAGRAKWRADMIARTEMMRSSNLAQNYVYNQNKKLVDERVWITRPENQYLRGRRRLCDDCLDRKDKTEDEVRKLAAAQGLPLEPPIHPHCSCMWALRPKPWSELMDKDTALKLKFAEEGTGNIMDFNRWKAQFV